MCSLRSQTVDQFGQDRTGKIQYQFNRQGFRSNFDFNKIPLCALFGCSSVFGIGVDNNNTTAAYLKNAYNFGLAGQYTNHDIFRTIKSYLSSKLYSPTTNVIVVWSDRDQECLNQYVDDLGTFNHRLMYNFFCGNTVPGEKNFKFICNIDFDVSNTHMGPSTHKLFAKIVWNILNQ